MKLYDQLKYMGVAMLSVMALASCGDDNDWQPGESYNTKNQVVVSSGDPDAGEVAANETTSFTVTFSREDSNGAISAPVTLSNTDLFSAPATVDFADGESSSSVDVTFNGTSSLGNYTCDVAIAYGEYNNPYSESSNSCHLEVMVGEWQLIHSNVVVYSDNLQSAYGFPDIYCDLEQFSGTNLYRLKDFAKDYNFVFELDKNNYITPRGGSIYSTYYWYVSDDTWNSEAPLIFKEDTTHKLSWAYFYLGGYSALNISTGFGYLYLGQGYWTSVTDENDYKQIDWEYLYIWWNTAE
jgi:hypothetical protein